MCVFQRGGGRQRCRRHRRIRIISRVRRTGMVCVSPGMCGHHRGWRQREWLYLWLHSTRLSRYENQHTVDSKSPLLCINIFIFEGATRFAANPVWPCHLRETDLQGRSEPYVPGELNKVNTLRASPQSLSWLAIISTSSVQVIALRGSTPKREVSCRVWSCLKYKISMKCNAAPYKDMQSNQMPCHAMPCNAKKHYAMQTNAMPCNAMQCHAR